jgi:hypothetical protein
MTAFDLPLTDGKPLEIVDFHVDLVVSPPEVKENRIESIDHYISDCKDVIKIDYKDAPLKEGQLNIYVCKFKTGKYCLHIFGKIKGRDFRIEKEIRANANALQLLQKRIKFVLVNSRNILRTYYVNSNLKSLENHLLAFLIPIK